MLVTSTLSNIFKQDTFRSSYVIVIAGESNAVLQR